MTFAASTCTYLPQASADEATVNLAKDKVGWPDQMIDISKVCGTKPIKVALADGFGSNSWRKITRAEFEDEAKKCPNIKEIRYTDSGTSGTEIRCHSRLSRWG